MRDEGEEDMSMDAKRIEHLRRLALPADHQGTSTHRAPATAAALGEALDEVERLRGALEGVRATVYYCGTHRAIPGRPCTDGEEACARRIFKRELLRG